MDIKKMLDMEGFIDLIIPRGSNKLVKFIQENTKIPVLGHASGICHIFVNKDADFDMAKNICIDAKTQYPTACNAVETILVHKDFMEYNYCRTADFIGCKNPAFQYSYQIYHIKSRESVKEGEGNRCMVAHCQNCIATISASRSEVNDLPPP